MGQHDPTVRGQASSSFHQKNKCDLLHVLSELCSNNVTEYQALIIGLQMALEMGIIEMEVYGDSKLSINQLLNIYEVKKCDLVPFFRQASYLLKGFENVTLNHILRKEIGWLMH
ncbi:UNVERIFIED_CONTAM: hypothetical protein Slati_0477100 [Sesamum latifolium]|uniref:RNase H type-1 domain-containing protein n=1 Tax=Sesamum latifolium TaxID=2727402 RepID=A0AAW2XWW2_9LAMI